MNKAEKYIVSLLAVLGVLLLGYFYSQTAIVRHLDSVFLFETLTGILETGKPVSESVSSWPLLSQILATPPAEVCAMSFGFANPVAYNVLDNHAYLILYPLALLSTLIGAEGVFALLNAVAYIGLLFLPYLFLRNSGLPRLSAFIFSLCVLCYPGWSLGAVGDYYIDRIYMPFMLVLLYLLHEHTKRESKNKSLLSIAVLAIFLALFTERAAIMVIATLVFFSALFPSFRRHKNTLPVVLLVVGTIVVYLFSYFHFLHNGISSAGGMLDNAATSRKAIFTRLQDPKMLPFAVTNFMFIGWLVFFAGWRYALLVIGALVPNLLITIGGAELTGWATHYHSMYIPFLIFVASIGFVKVLQLIKSNAHKTLVSSIIGVSVFVFGWCFDPVTASWGKGERGSFGVTSSVFRFYVKPHQSGDLATAQWLRTLSTEIPVGAKISATEGVMPALYDSRHLALYPYGMDEAEYLVIGGTASNGIPTVITGAINYLDGVKLNECLAARAANQGFVFYKDFPAVGVLIFKRASLQ